MAALIMVVGSGMLAKAFNHFKDDPSVIIFASGVSNSGEKEQEAFERERKLLLSLIPTTAKLVYFSTISVEDPSLKNSHYIKHKLEIESLIQKEFVNFLIFRLPNLVGRSENPHTLTNFIFHRIKSHLTIPVFSRARRFLIDVEDVEALLTPLIEDEAFVNRKENIFFDEAVSMSALIKIFEEILSVSATIEMSDKGSEYHPENSFFRDYLASRNYNLEKNSLENLIRKYYS